MPSNIHFSSKNMNLQTPRELVELIREFFDGSIDLDPATCDTNPTGALDFFTPKEDGLKQAWLPGYETPTKVFCNPPYGRQIGQWVEKARKEWRAGLNDGDEIIMLVPARTDTKWFSRSMCEAWCAIRGRLHFIDPDTGEPLLVQSKKQGKLVPAKAPFPSALLYWGYCADEFGEFFSRLGDIYVRK